MLCPCSFIILHVHIEPQVYVLGLYLGGGLTFRMILGVVYRGLIFGEAYIPDFTACLDAQRKHHTNIIIQTTDEPFVQ